MIICETAFVVTRLYHVSKLVSSSHCPTSVVRAELGPGTYSLAPTVWGLRSEAYIFGPTGWGLQAGAYSLGPTVSACSLWQSVCGLLLGLVA